MKHFRPSRHGDSSVSVLLAALLLVGTACSDPPAVGGDEPDTSVGEPDSGDDTTIAPDAGEDAGTDPTDAGGDVCVTNDDCASKVDAKAANCEIAVCTAGKCEVGAAADGAKCDDGWECTDDETCAAGKCKKGNGGTGQACTKDHPDFPAGKVVECLIPTCDALGSGGCDWNSVPPSAAKECDDGNKCTTDNICTQGQCLGKLVDGKTDCDDDNDCTDDLCKPDDGCVNVDLADGIVCNDGDQCTSGNKCSKGVCAGGVKVTCDDKDPCTEDTCEKDSGCKFKVLPDGVTCDDGSKCTEKDACKQGTCGGQEIESAKAPNACVAAKCDPLTGKTEFDQVADGKVCDDDDPCSNGDTCKGGSCNGTVLKCNDSNPCTKDACDPAVGTCKSVPLANGVTCTDNNLCTSLDNCLDGVCKGEAHTSTGSCNDDNPCTNDGCLPLTGCFHTSKPGICSDNDPCTVNDKCDGKSCKGLPKNCNDGDSCTNDACAKDNNGKCNHTGFVGPCDDNNKCTQSDSCNDKGKCIGSDIDCDDKNECTIDVCASDKGCTYINVKGGTACEDGLACTKQEVCDSGKCLVVKNECTVCAQDGDCSKLDDGDPCTGTVKCIDGGANKKVCDVPKASIPDCTKIGDGICSIGSCDKKTGTCEKQLKPDGAPCADGNKCTAKTFCDKGGSCLGTKVDCDDNESCTTDSCDPKIGCLHAKIDDGEVCDDNNKCTGGDTCSTGVCTAKTNTCPCVADKDCVKFDDGDLCNGVFQCTGNKCIAKKDSQVVCTESKVACVENFCQKNTGKCEPIKQANGTPCDDADKCTLKDTCSAGKCDGDDALKAGLCDDKNVCTTDICDPFFGCNNAKKGVGAACDDGNACTTKTKCNKDDICAGEKIDCDDGNSCTLDGCKAGSGCFNQIDNTLKCDDNNPCTAKDRCDNGVCSADDVDCDDSNPCTIDVCAGKDGCKNVIQGGKDCDDGQPCTITDRCDLAGKCAGKTKNCDDGTACTEDSCVNGACVSQAKIGLPCDDGSKCTDKDACDKEGVCKSVEIDCEGALDGNKCRKVVGGCSPQNGCTYADNDGVSCQDGNQCTIADKCSGGSCSGLPLKCDDSNPCTLDNCDPAAGCQNKINTCDDANDCTFDKCDPPKSTQNPNATGKGCVNSAIDGFQPCNDDNPCTTEGKCSGSKCELKALSCNDENVCTLDSCDSKYELKKDDKPSAACVYLPESSTATICDDGDKCTSDHCDGLGKCTGDKIDCDDGNDCTVDACDKLKGCIKSDAKDGLTCDDGDVCTKDTKCNGGLCAGGAKTCFQCEQQKDCDAFDNSTRCDGWLECVKTDGLKFGTCIPRNDPNKGQEPIVCDSLDDTQCERNTCQPATGKCEMTQSLNGSACEDGNACTVNDTCTGGKCKTGILADCSSVEDPCNFSECRANVESKAGYECVAIAKLPFPATPLCDADGSGCTAHDYCQEGKCIAGPSVDCSGTAEECEVAACKSTGSKSFTCEKKPAKDGDECDDKQFCTAEDTCKSGKCTAGLKAPDCTQFDGACSVGVCDTKVNGGFGACQPQIKKDSDKKPCNSDDNGCTVNDICANGVCVAGAPPDCSKSNSTCTIGACKSTGALQFECVAAAANETKPCEADNDGCTVGDRCSQGKCVVGSAPDCKDKGDGKCLIGSCKSLGNAHYSCTGVPAKGGTPCDADSNGCTRNDACNDKGACQPGPSVNCNADGGSCSTGSCVSTTAETFECQGQSKADGTTCDSDANGCTVGDKCVSGKCVAGAGPDCTKFDSGQCVIGGCTTKGSDKYICEAYPKKNGEGCDADKDGCTRNDACEGGSCTKGLLETCKDLAGVCVSESCKSEGTNAFKCLIVAKESYKALEPAVACTPTTGKAQDSCEKGYICNQTGEVSDPKFGKVKVGLCAPSVSITCDDGSQCTSSDACHNGSCAGGQPTVCDDDDPCTLDSCNPKDGACKSAPLVGCVKCIDSDFEPGTGAGNQGLKDWAVTSKFKEFVEWKTDAKAAVKNSEAGVAAIWKGQHKYKDATGKEVVSVQPILTRLMHRRYYIRNGSIPPVMQFRILAKFLDQGCDRDVLQVVVNNKVMYEQCSDTDATKFTGANTTERITISMAEWAGDAVDVEFRVWADGSNTQSEGSVLIDNVILAGDCGPGCAAYGFETRGLIAPYDPSGPNQAPPVLKPLLPQPIQLKASAANYMAWKVVDKGQYSGAGAISATYTGAPPGAQSQSASMMLPKIRPLSKDTLYFAMKLAGLGGEGNELEVRAHLWDTAENKIISSSSLYKRVSAQENWSIQKLDLSQFAGKTIDVEFIAKTASKGGDAKGTFMLDAIAVQGLCTYACFYEPFDAYGISRWRTESDDKEKTTKLVSDKFASAPNSIYTSYPSGKGTSGKPLIFTGKTQDDLTIVGSVLGMTYEYDVNLFMSAAICPPPGGPGVNQQSIASLLYRGVYTDYPDQEYANATAIPPDDPRFFDIHGNCESTTGWVRKKGAIDDVTRGRHLQVQMWLASPTQVKETKGYFDNLTLICK